MKPGRSSGRPAPRAGRQGGASGKRSTPNPKAQRPATSRREADSPAPDLAGLGPFRLGVVPGATPGKWIDVWKQRMPRNDLHLVSLDVARQVEAFDEGAVDAALVRLPIDRDGLSVITLYDETTVTVCSIDSSLTAADELTLADLVGEVVMVPDDDVLALEVPGALAPSFAPLPTTEDAVTTAATGVGIALMPMSLARLHHRKDVAYRPVTGAPTPTVALAWRTEATTLLVETFIGIVRGRTANSSR